MKTHLNIKVINLFSYCGEMCVDYFDSFFSTEQLKRKLQQKNNNLIYLNISFKTLAEFKLILISKFLLKYFNNKFITLFLKILLDFILIS